MLVNVLGNPVSVFLDSNGQPLQGGSIYIGQPNTDPTNPVNQITVFQDQGLSIPLQQPIKTTNGQPSLNGQQIPVYLGLGVTTYALAALNAGGVVVMSQPSVAPFSLGGSAGGSMVFKSFSSANGDFVQGTAPTLTLPWNLGSANNAFVDADGLEQKPGIDYTLTGTSLSFTAAFPAGSPNTINVRGGTTTPVSTPGAGTITDASVAANAGINSSKLSFIALATGAVPETVQVRLSQFLSVKDFGAKGDGTTDDTAAIQTAINAAVAGTLLLFFPPGTYLYSSLAISGALTVLGSGRFVTTLLCSSLTNNNVTINTALGVKFEGLAFNVNGTPTAGSAVQITAQSSYNQGCVFRDCAFNGNFIGIDTLNAASWVVDACFFSQNISAGILVQNAANVDAGDSVISNCTFASGVANSVGVLQYSSGGLKVVGNKFVGFGYAYFMQLQHGATTGDLLITGNSIEGFSVAGIELTRVAGGAQDMAFSDVMITGNQFLATGSGIPINLVDANAGWQQGFCISGNVLDCFHSGTPAAAILVNAVNGFSISGNQIFGTAGSNAGISIGAGATNGLVGRNQISGYSANLSVVNNSTTTEVQPKRLEGITGSAITCSTGVGSVFQGTQVINFPAGFFTDTPQIEACVSGGSNGIAAGSTTSTPSAATLFATAATNGATVLVKWTATAPN